MSRVSDTLRQRKFVKKHGDHMMARLGSICKQRHSAVVAVTKNESVLSKESLLQEVKVSWSIAFKNGA